MRSYSGRFKRRSPWERRRAPPLAPFPSRPAEGRVPEGNCTGECHAETLVMPRSAGGALRAERCVRCGQINDYRLIDSAGHTERMGPAARAAFLAERAAHSA